MPTTIDSLVLELGIDTRRLSSGQRQAIEDLRKFEDETKKIGGRVEGEHKRIGNVLNDMRRSFGLGFGALIGGGAAVGALKLFTNLEASAQRLGKTMNMSGQEVRIWQSMFRQMGGAADGANQSLAGLSRATHDFATTGQASGDMLAVLSRLQVDLRDGSGAWKDPGKVWMEIAEAIERMKIPAGEAVSMLNKLPGMNETLLNMILKGPDAMRRQYDIAEKLVRSTKDSAENAEKFQEEFAKAEQSAIHIGTQLGNFVLPAINRLLDGVTKIMNRTAGDAKTLLETPGAPAGPFERFLSKSMGIPVRGQQYHWGKSPTTADGHPAESTSSAGTGKPIPIKQGLPTPEEMEAYIRLAALARGIDPNIAVRVAKSEGLYAYKYSNTGKSFVSGEDSFGPFQLNYAKNGRSLGDKFTKTTGLDARDASTWQRQVDFSMDEASRGGWGPWHGWKGAPRAGIGARGVAAGGFPGGSMLGASSGGSNTVTVGTIQVNAPNADPAIVAAQIGPSLDRWMTAAGALNGAN